MHQLEFTLKIDWLPAPPRIRRSRRACCQLIRAVQLELDLRYGRERVAPDEYAFRSAECHASKLFGHYRFTRTDVEDIKSDLIAYLWERSDQWDPARGAWTTFVTRVMKNRILNIIAHRRARKRDYRCEVSIDAITSRESTWN
jgi:hypothetical protein